MIIEEMNMLFRSPRYKAIYEISEGGRQPDKSESPELYQWAQVLLWAVTTIVTQDFNEIGEGISMVWLRGAGYGDDILTDRRSLKMS